VKTEATRVLVIEDNPGDARLVKEALSEVKRARFELEFVERLDAGIDRLGEGGIDVVLLDLGLPDATGFDGIARIQTEAPTVPIVVLTGSDDAAVARGAVNAGAQDFVVKGDLAPDVLGRTLTYAIDRQRTLIELSQLNRRLEATNDLRNEFVAIVAHDLRGPMTTVAGFADLLVDRWGSWEDGEKIEFLQAISRNTKHLAEFVEDVLQVARVEAGEFAFEIRAFDIRSLTQRALDEVAGAHVDRRFELDAVDDFPLALGDEDRQWQVLTNLLSNAVKFSPPGEPVAIALSCNGDSVQVAVTDRGPGIAESDVPKLFQKFGRLSTPESRRVPGTGLGLYICKTMVETQGGRLWCESSPGRGSTFLYTIPVAR